MAATIGNIYTLQPDDINGMNALVDTTLNRETSGYISPYSANNSSTKNKLLGACGTVEDVNSKPGNFLGGGLIGLLIAYAIRPRKRTVLVRY
jgi:hypothetical protein